VLLLCYFAAERVGQCMTATCLWCESPTPGPVQMHGGKCWGLAERCGWFEADSIARRKARKSSATGAEKKVKMEDGMKWESRQNECGLFRNTLHPEKSDFNGRIDVLCPSCSNVGGYWVSGWTKLTSAGGKYLKIKLRVRTPGRGPNEPQTRTERCASSSRVTRNRILIDARQRQNRNFPRCLFLIVGE
jgi:hypothetical protein